MITTEDGEEVVEEEPVEGGLNFDEFVAVFDQAKEQSAKYTESILTEALMSLEESKILDSGEIIKVVPKEKLGEFLCTFGDVLTDDDMKDFCAEFDAMGSGEFNTTELGLRDDSV